MAARSIHITNGGTLIGAVSAALPKSGDYTMLITWRYGSTTASVRRIKPLSFVGASATERAYIKSNEWTPDTNLEAQINSGAATVTWSNGGTWPSDTWSSAVAVFKEPVGATDGSITLWVNGVLARSVTVAAGSYTGWDSGDLHLELGRAVDPMDNADDYLGQAAYWNVAVSDAEAVRLSTQASSSAVDPAGDNLLFLYQPADTDSGVLPNLATGPQALAGYSLTIPGTGAVLSTEVPSWFAPLPTLDSAPTGLAASNLTQTTLDLTWDALDGATSYSLKRDGVEIATPTGTSFSDSGLTADTDYVYTVAGVNVNGTGPYSAGVTAHTLAEDETPVVENKSIHITAGAPTAGALVGAEDARFAPNGNNSFFFVFRVGATGPTANEAVFIGTTAGAAFLHATLKHDATNHIDTVEITLRKGDNSVVAYGSVNGLASEEFHAVAVVLVQPTASTAGSLAGFVDGVKVINVVIPVGVLPAWTPIGGGTNPALALCRPYFGDTGLDYRLAEYGHWKRALSDAEAIALTGSSHADVDPADSGIQIYYQPRTGDTALVNRATGAVAMTGYNIALNAIAVLDDLIPDWLQNPPDAAPTGLAASDKTDVSLTLSCDDAGPYIRYEWFQDGASLGVTDTPSKGVTGLTGGTTYTFKARLVNGGGPGPFTADLSVTMLAADAEDPVAGSLTLASKTDHSLTFTVGAGTDNYGVYSRSVALYSDAGMTQQVGATTVLDPDATTVTFSDLTSAVSYYARATWADAAGNTATATLAATTDNLQDFFVQTIANLHTMWLWFDLREVAPAIYDGGAEPSLMPPPEGDRARLWWSTDGVGWHEAQDFYRVQAPTVDLPNVPADPRMEGVVFGLNEGTEYHFKITFEGADSGWPTYLEKTFTATTATSSPTMGATVAEVGVSASDTNSSLSAKVKAAFDGGADVVELYNADAPGEPLISRAALLTYTDGAIVYKGTAGAWKGIRLKDGETITFDGSDPTYDAIGAGNWTLYTDAARGITAEMGVYKSAAKLAESLSHNIYYERPDDTVGTKVLNVSNGILTGHDWMGPGYCTGIDIPPDVTIHSCTSWTDYRGVFLNVYVNETYLFQREMTVTLSGCSDARINGTWEVADYQIDASQSPSGIASFVVFLGPTFAGGAVASTGGTASTSDSTMLQRVQRNGAAYVYVDDGSGAQGEIYLRLHHGVDPNTCRIKVCAPTEFASVSGAEYFVLDGLTAKYFGNAGFGGILVQSGSHLVFKDVKMVGGRGFIQSAGAPCRYTVIDGCDLEMRGQGADTYPDPLPNPDWSWVKASPDEETGIFTGFVGLTIHDTRIIGPFNGAGGGGSINVTYDDSFHITDNELVSQQVAQAIEISECSFVGCGDDSTETEADILGMTAWENTFIACYKGISLAPIRYGGTWILRNQWYGRGEYELMADVQCFTKLGNDSQGNCVARKFFAHNTIYNVNRDQLAGQPLVGFMNSGSTYNYYFLNNAQVVDAIAIFDGYGSGGFPQILDGNRYTLARPYFGGDNRGDTQFWGFQVFAYAQGDNNTLTGSGKRTFQDFFDWQRGNAETASDMPGYTGDIPTQMVRGAMGDARNDGRPALELVWLHDPYGTDGVLHGLTNPDIHDVTPLDTMGFVGAAVPLANINYDCGPYWSKYNEAQVATSGALPVPLVGSGVPAAPTVALDHATPTTAVFNVTPVSGASFYEAYRDGVFMGRFRATAIRIQGLAPGASHTFTFKAGNGWGVSAASSGVPVTQLSPAASAPTGGTVTLVSATGYSVTVNVGTGDGGTEDIEVITVRVLNSDGVRLVGDRVVTPGQHTIFHLPPDTALRIEAIYATYAALATTTVLNTTTLSADTVAAPVVKLSAPGRYEAGQTVVNGFGVAADDGATGYTKGTLTAVPAGSGLPTGDIATVLSPTGSGGYIAFTPDVAGTYSVKLEANAASDPSLVGSDTLDIVVEAASEPPVNTAPSVAFGTPTAAEAGETMTVGYQITDAEGGAMTRVIEVTAKPAGSTLTAGDIGDAKNGNTGTLSIPGDVAGSYTLKLTATDSGGLSGSATITVTFSAPAPTNTAPTVTAGAAPTGVTVGQSFTATWTCADAEGGNIAYALTVVAKPAESVAASITLNAPTGVGTATATGTVDVAGSYTLRVTATDSGGLSSHADVTFTAAAAVAPPRVDVTLREMMGVGAPGGNMYRLDYPWDAIAQSGVTWVRVNPAWQAVDPWGSGNRDFSAFEYARSQAGARGLKVIVLLAYGNVAYGMATELTPPAPGAQTDAYIGYVLGAIEVFGTADAQYEVWNEAHRFWDPIGGYAAFAQAVATAVLAEYPDAKLLFGGGLAWNPDEDSWAATSNKSATTLSLLAEPNALDGYDKVSLHPYRKEVPETLKRDIQSLYDAGTVPIPLAQTEWAYPDGWRFAEPIDHSNYGDPYPGGKGVAQWTDAFVTEELGGAFALRMVFIGADLGWPLMMWLIYNDFATPESQYTDWGLATVNGQPKPAYIYWRFLASRFGGYKWAETLSTVTVWAMRFTCAGKPDMVAAWTMYSFDTGTRDVPAGGAAYSADGTLLATSGTVTLTQTPSYFVDEPLPAFPAPTVAWGTAPTGQKTASNPRCNILLGGAGGFPVVPTVSVTKKPADSGLLSTQIYIEPDYVNGVWQGGIRAWSYVDKPGDWEWTLTGTGPDGQEASTVLAFTVTDSGTVNTPPVVTAGEVLPEAPHVGDPVTVALSYTDPDADQTHVVTPVLTGPEGSAAAPTVNHDAAAKSVVVLFTPDKAGTYTVGATVSDGGAEDTATVEVEAAESVNAPVVTPVLSLVTATTGAQVSLQVVTTAGTVTAALLTKPAGSVVSLGALSVSEGGGRETVTLTPDAPGSYVVRFTATAGGLSSYADVALVAMPAPVAAGVSSRISGRQIVAGSLSPSVMDDIAAWKAALGIP